MIKSGIKKEVRLQNLRDIVLSQLKSLASSTDMEHKLTESPNKKEEIAPTNSFDNSLKGLLRVPPPRKDEK